MANRTLSGPGQGGPAHIHGVLSFTGMRRSGKTTIAKIVAERIGAQFFDTDAIFTEWHRCTVNDYLAKSSWLSFRAAESVIIRDLFSSLPDVAVVSLGGGTLAHSDSSHYRNMNIKIVTRKGPVVYLTPSSDLPTSARILTEREQEGGFDLNRPALPLSDPSARSLYEKNLATLRQRHPFYTAASAGSRGFVVYECDKAGTKEEVISRRADEIIRKISVLLRA